jgi:nitric oxide reductase large subunit
VSFTRHGVARYSSLVFALLRGAPLVWIAVALLGLSFIFLPAFSLFRHSAFGLLSALLWLALIAAVGLALVIGRSLARLPRTRLWPLLVLDLVSRGQRGR